LRQNIDLCARILQAPFDRNQHTVQKLCQFHFLI
jgi:hypothetical protein